MVAEMRAQRLELDNRRHFSGEGEPIQDSRAFIAELLEFEYPDPEQVVAKSAMSFQTAAVDDVFEVG